jgi:hypothetical protein
MRRQISAKKMTALILLVTRYPNTFETAKNTIKYRKYLLVNNWDASFAKLIVLYIYNI